MVNIILLFSCSNIPASISIAEIKPWLDKEQNGFSKGRTIGAIEFKATYLPPEFMAAQEMTNISKVISKKEFYRILPQYKNTYSFNLRVKIGDGTTNIFNATSETSIEGENRLEYYMNNFKDDVCLVSGIDTIRCIEAMAENNFKLSPYSDITLLFFDEQNKLKQEDICLVVSDKLFGTSYTNYCYKKSQIGQFPKIEF